MPYAHIVKPNEKVKLSDIDPGESRGLDKDVAHVELDKLGKEMADLQELMFAAGMHSLLVVLQGRDTSGKDGTIRRLLSYMNVQSTRVASFKQPTEAELGHDFLWRVHSQAPGKGGVTIFNRSHYEDVLVVRVHDIVPKGVWKKRYEHINNFEKLLTDSSTIVVKFYLHISKDEQEQRLLAREQDEDKAWKLSVGDWKERELWDSYTDAYEDALEECSTKKAPWRIIPANHKWFRDLAVAEAIVDELKGYKREWHEHLHQIGVVKLAELAEMRKVKPKAAKK